MPCAESHDNVESKRCKQQSHGNNPNAHIEFLLVNGSLLSHFPNSAFTVQLDNKIDQLYCTSMFTWSRVIAFILFHWVRVC